MAHRGDAFIQPVLRQRCKPLQNVVQEEAQPDAFTFAFDTHPVHPVIPVTSPHQRQAMPPEPKSMANSFDTV